MVGIVQNRIFKYLCLFIGLSGFAACRSRQHIINASRKEYQINNRLSDDSAIVAVYLPYKRKMDMQMNQVLGSCSHELVKSNDPETTLGDFFSDAVLSESRKLDPQIDFALPSTKGGLRNHLPPGDIHLYNLFELMPFENEAVVLSLKGSDVQQLLTAIAEAGGEPVAGLRMQIKDKRPLNVYINNLPFDPAKTYHVLTSDYVAGGGDHINGLQHPLSQQVLGLKIRDALINYVKQQTAVHQIINTQTDGRITRL